MTRVAVEALPRVKLHANDMQVYVHKMAEAVIDVVVAAAGFFEIFDSDEEEEKEQRRRRSQHGVANGASGRFWVHDVNRRREVWPFCFITWRSENTVKIQLLRLVFSHNFFLHASAATSRITE